MPGGGTFKCLINWATNVAELAALLQRLHHYGISLERAGYVGVPKASEGRPATAALRGDWQTSAFKPRFEIYLQQQSISGVFVGDGGCPPSQGILKAQFDDGQLCLECSLRRSNIERPMIPSKPLFHARWTLSIEGVCCGLEVGQDCMLRDVLMKSG